MIGIIDCRIGNIGSLRNAFSFLGADAEVICRPHDLNNCDGIVLPGVGAFDAAMSSVDDSGFSAAIKTYVGSGRPLLGICLGLQLICDSSEEGTRPGLGLVEGQVIHLKRIGCKGKIPHVGFNSIQEVERPSPFLSGLEGHDFYFIHSYALSNTSADASLAYVEYEEATFVAAFQYRNIFATQFHPEKSGEAGLMTLQRFLSCLRSV